MSKVQCAHCPWKKGVKPAKDIPGGYCATKHCALKSTIAEPGSFLGTGRAMACHESEVGKERVCVGWAVNQLGVGNNIALRFQAMKDTTLHGLQTVGPHHQRFEDTLPKRRRRSA